MAIGAALLGDDEGMVAGYRCLVAGAYYAKTRAPIAHRPGCIPAPPSEEQQPVAVHGVGVHVPNRGGVHAVGLGTAQ